MTPTRRMKEPPFGEDAGAEASVIRDTKVEESGRPLPLQSSAGPAACSPTDSPDPSRLEMRQRPPSGLGPLVARVLGYHSGACCRAICFLKVGWQEAAGRRRQLAANRAPKRSCQRSLVSILLFANAAQGLCSNNCGVGRLRLTAERWLLIA